MDKNIILYFLKYGFGQTIRAIFLQEVTYYLGLAFLFSGIFYFCTYIPKNKNYRDMQNLKRGDIKKKKYLNDKAVTKKISKMTDQELDDETQTGVSCETGKPFSINDKQLNQTMMIFGTTGAGKTVTLKNFYKSFIRKKQPLIIIDGKPDDDIIDFIYNEAKSVGSKVYGFNSMNYCVYNPFSVGTHTVLKDKIISLTEATKGDSDFYRNIAQVYLQTMLEAVLDVGDEPTLELLIELLDFSRLAAYSVNCSDNVQKRVQELKTFKKEHLINIYSQLLLLSNSEYGKYFGAGEGSFDLKTAIEENAVVYFALPQLKLPEFAKVLGKLVINDLKATIDYQSEKKKVFCVFDEFSVFAGSQVLNLINMGRGKGIHSIFATQGLADLEVEGKTQFKRQLMNCFNTLIIQRMNEYESVEEACEWIGYEDHLSSTVSVDNVKLNTQGYVKKNREFIINPEDVQNGLLNGESIVCSKYNGFEIEKVKIRFIE
jgi:type IV secretory pathway TraG/TraD family ATPase VirD4